MQRNWLPVNEQSSKRCSPVSSESARLRLQQEPRRYPATYISKPEILSGVVVGQLGVINSRKMKHGGMKPLLRYS